MRSSSQLHIRVLTRITLIRLFRSEALAFGADFGGNATIIGASANVVAFGLVRKT